MDTRRLEADPARQAWLRLGGISALVLGAGYILIIAVYMLAGALPPGVEAQLAALGERTGVWWLILGLSVFTDLLFLPVALALYLVLNSQQRPTALVGSALLALFVGLDLAVTWPNYSALITLAAQYHAAGQVQRSLLVAAATYPSAVLDSGLFAVYAILIPSLGILLLSRLMLGGPFGKLTAITGLASGILGIIAVVGPLLLDALGILAVLSSILTTVWLLLAGWRLLRPAAPPPTLPSR